MWAAQLDSVSVRSLKQSCGFSSSTQKAALKKDHLQSDTDNHVFCVSSLSLLRSVWNAAALGDVCVPSKKRKSHQNTSTMNNFTWKQVLSCYDLCMRSIFLSDFKFLIKDTLTSFESSSTASILIRFRPAFSVLEDEVVFCWQLTMIHIMVKTASCGGQCTSSSAGEYKTKSLTFFAAPIFPGNFLKMIFRKLCAIKLHWLSSYT